MKPRDMILWVEGWNEAQGGEAPLEAMSADEYRELVKAYG